ncbi:DMT family transporter [Reyranella aquatilis]|uniref:DMT family transporter n=1 Tax=Reyranella aquatilis TaxID=2035356 RepID=A0ABS8KNB0_9HYPH|nr:DMT family transporter [Reyranella aquatilis]MCC8427553.1 DMT family transporter [Reyranella aquatilis]
MNRPGPLWAAAGTGIQVGAAMVATRYVVDAAGPGSLGFLRYLIGLACLAPALWLRPWRRIAARELLPIGLLGIGQFAALIVLLNYSLLHIPAARASLLFSTFPLMTMTLSALGGRERFTPAKIGGALLTFAGVAIALGGAAITAEPQHGSAWLGTVAALGAALCGAVCSISYAPYVARYSALPVTAFAMFVAVLALAGVAAAEGLFTAWPAFKAGEVSAIVFIGVSSGIGFFLWVYALGNAPPTLVTIFLGLGPVTAALGGTLLLGEPLPVAALLGLACVLAGLWLALKPAAQTE